jgi:acyl-CoA hydrolase/GNAT superfamily N-acetyltransferase
MGGEVSEGIKVTLIDLIEALRRSQMNLPESIKRKLVSAEEAISIIKSGENVFVGTACATPRVLIAAIEDHHANLSDLQIFHFVTNGAIPMKNEEPITRFQHRTFFVGSNERIAIKSGQSDYIPISIAQVPSLIENGRMPVDTALIQVSPPEGDQYVSLGISVDITKCAVRNAKKVIAELNPNMPLTYGDTFIPIDQIDHFVLVDAPLIEYEHPAVESTIVEQIARYVAGIIDDGSTLQIGLGRIPNHMLKFLENRRDIGIHSDVITDSLIELMKKGVITGRRKTMHQNQIVTSYCIGTHRLYEMINRNPLFAFYPLEYVCNQYNISRNNKMVSVSQAFAIDLTGQICADQFEGEFYGGVSTQPDFLRGAAASQGGKPIICLPSTTEDGKYSRIRPLLMSGEGVTISRSDVHYVITEFGIAYLFGKSIRERSLALIEIAHPDFRPWLLEEAKKLGYVRPDQSLESKVAYPIQEEREMTLKNGSKIMIRPTKASDVEMLQNLFYHMSKQDIYTRFFRRLQSLPVSQAQHFCNVDYETAMAFIAVMGVRENEQIIGSSMYVMDHATNLAEVAFMIRPEWQKVGLGRALQNRLVEYAKSKGLRGFTAQILIENDKMISLIKKVSDKIQSKCDSGVYEITALF